MVGYSGGVNLKPPCLLLVLLGAVSTAAAAEDLPPIEVGDWAYAGAGSATIMFVKPEPAPEGSPYSRLWVRFEEAKPFDRRGFVSMSNVELDDVDCAGRRTRTLRDTRYSQRNMRGESHVEAIESPAWRIEEEGSFGAAILSAACGGGAGGDPI